MKLCILFSIISIILLINFLRRKTLTLTQALIPKIIFTFWSSNDESHAALTRECISTWTEHNPSWQIVILDDNLISKYAPKTYSKQFVSVQSYSDAIRLEVLERFGGVWIDASVYMNEPLDWVHDAQKKYRATLIGFQNPIRPHINIMENWFIACTPRHPFISAWRECTLGVHDTQDFLNGIDPLIVSSVEDPFYLLHNVCWKVTYNLNPKMQQSIQLLDSQNTVFRLHHMSHWDPDTFASNFKKHKKIIRPFIKLTSTERNAILKSDS